MLSTPQPRYLSFKSFQRHNPDIFPSNDINATTQISSFQMLSMPQPRYLSSLQYFHRRQPGFLTFTCFQHRHPVFSLHILSTSQPGCLPISCFQRHHPVFFSSHTINVTTRVSSNHRPLTPPFGFLPFTCYQRHNPDVFPVYVIIARILIRR